MQRHSSTNSTKSQHNSKNMLHKHVSNDDFYSTSPKVRRQRMAPLKTQYTVYSIRSTDENKEIYQRATDSLIRKGLRGRRTKQNQGYCTSERTKLTKLTTDESENMISCTHRKNMRRKEPQFFKQEQKSAHITEIKQIVGYLIDKLMCNNFPEDYQRHTSRSPRSHVKRNQQIPIQQLIYSQQNDLIRNREEELITAQNKTNDLVEQLSNVKDLWEKANGLRMQLMKYQYNIKKQRGSYMTPNNSDYQSSFRETSYKQSLMKELSKLVHSAQMMESQKNSKELQLFEKNIAHHLVELKSKMNTLQQSNNQGMVAKCGELQEIILRLQRRNKELQSDNIKILEQNQKIHQKICELQQFYQGKNNDLQVKINELRKQTDAPNELEEQIEGYQYEIQNLKLEVAHIEEEKQHAVLQMEMMRNTIELLTREKVELEQIVDHFEKKQIESSENNTLIISELKEKISGLEKQFHVMETSYKYTRHTTLNPSQEKIDQTHSSILEEVKESIVIKKQDLQSSEIEMFELRKAKDQLEEQLKSCKQMLLQKQELSSTFILNSNIKQEKDETKMVEDILQMMSQHLDKYCQYEGGQKEKLLQFVQRALVSKLSELPTLVYASKSHTLVDNIVYEEQEIQNLSCRSFREELDDERQPTFMQVFSKFDERQESIFRLIDYIGTNLKTGDLLTEFVNEFVMKAMPNKDYEVYQKITEQFVTKIKQYQERRIVTVDKSLSEYIINTQNIFKEKDQIEAILDESSDDQDEDDKYLWQDILNPKEEVKFIVKKGRVPLHRVMAVNRKYSDKNRNVELLPIIPEEKQKQKQKQKHKKNKSVLFNQSHSSEQIYIPNTPKKKSSYRSNCSNQ